SKRLMPPHTHRPPPRAMTRVCKTSIALVKKLIFTVPFVQLNCWVEGRWLSIRTDRKARPVSRWPVCVSCTVQCQRCFSCRRRQGTCSGDGGLYQTCH